MGLPVGGEAEPGTQVAGNLEDLAVLVEVDGINGEAHEAHVDAVAGRDEEPCRGRQRTAKHQPRQARPECISHMNLDAAAVIRMDEYALLHAINCPFCFFLPQIHGPLPPRKLSSFPVRGVTPQANTCS